MDLFFVFPQSNHGYYQVMENKNCRMRKYWDAIGVITVIILGIWILVFLCSCVGCEEKISMKDYQATIEAYETQYHQLRKKFINCQMGLEECRHSNCE